MLTSYHLTSSAALFLAPHFFIYVFSPDNNSFMAVSPQLADDELDGSDRELDMEEGGDLSDLQWGDSALPRPSSRQTSGTAVLMRADRSGRDTPASVDSIPLEWDHDYDLSRDLESPGGRGHRERRRVQEEEEDEYLRTAAAVLSGECRFRTSFCGSFQTYILLFGT